MTRLFRLRFRLQLQAKLIAAGQFDVDFRQQQGVEKRAMLDTVAVINAKATTEWPENRETCAAPSAAYRWPDHPPGYPIRPV